MRARRIAVIAAATTVAATGAGVAVGASNSDKGQEAEAKILADAAQRLGTTADKLRNALGAAEDAQLDAAVKAGELTQEQADAIKQRRQQSGRVLGIGPGLHGPAVPVPHGKGFGPPPGGPGLIEDIAQALGVTPGELFRQLGDGKSPADIARANGKSKADVKAAVLSAAEKRMDAAVKAGRLTRERADDILAHIGDEFEEHWDESGPPAPRGPHAPPPFGP